MSTSVKSVSPAMLVSSDPYLWRKRLYLLGMHTIMFLSVLLVTFPILFAIILSTQSPSDYYQVGNLVPGSAAGENFERAWSRANLGDLIGNTLRVALAVALGKIILSILAAYAVIYFRVRGKFLIFGVIMITHFLPLPVRIVPTFDLLVDLNWVNTFNGLTIPFFASATGFFLFIQFFRTVPPDLVDAARVDGAGPMRFLFHILIPISRTNIGALFLIEFVFMWNQYLWPLIASKSVETQQIQVGIKQLIATDSVIEWGVVMAGTVIVIIPPLIVLLILQRSLMAGLTASNQDF